MCWRRRRRLPHGGADERAGRLSRRPVGGRAGVPSGVGRRGSGADSPVAGHPCRATAPGGGQCRHRGGPVRSGQSGIHRPTGHHRGWRGGRSCRRRRPRRMGRALSAFPQWASPTMAPPTCAGCAPRRGQNASSPVAAPTTAARWSMPGARLPPDCSGPHMGTALVRSPSPPILAFLGLVGGIERAAFIRIHVARHNTLCFHGFCENRFPLFATCCRCVYPMGGDPRPQASQPDGGLTPWHATSPPSATRPATVRCC